MFGTYCIPGMILGAWDIHPEQNKQRSQPLWTLHFGGAVCFSI